VGIEACASSQYWSRRLQALGHTVQLMPPSYVKPHVKRQKNDSTDAEAICEAVTRPNMRFVASKTIEQQSCLMLHRVRHLIIRQQTAVINSLATSAVAGAEPMPGIASSRLLVAFDRCQAIMRLSNSRICELQDLSLQCPQLTAESRKTRAGNPGTRQSAGSATPTAVRHPCALPDKLGSISKQGDRNLGSRITAGALGVIRYECVLLIGT
jgi:transposase